MMLQDSLALAGPSFLLSTVPAPLNAIAYLTGVSGKQKITKSQRSLRLCGEPLQKVRS